MSNATNQFLDLVCARLRRARPPAPDSLDFSSRAETVGGTPFVSLWFRTRGCRHDARGGCTMCNYGASTVVPEDEMVEFVRRGLVALDLPSDAMLLLSPSGSMFDEWEVPAGARERIFALARGTKTRAIVCEARVDTLTSASVQQYAGVFSDRQAGVGFGLESADPWVSKYCVNKALAPDDCRSAIVMLRSHGVVSTANVLLGAPFLSAAESVADAVASLRWALAEGADQCVLFPAHVKSFTLVEWLWRRQSFAPPSLWALVEVLLRLGPDLASRVTISWYKDYFAARQADEAAGDPTFLCSPTTCPDCHDAVMARLDEYRAQGRFETIRELASFDCDCRHRWRALLDEPVTTLLQQRVAEAYEAIGRGVLGDEWWLRNGRGVLEGLQAR